MSAITDIVVPAWYIEAKAANASDTELKTKIHEFCVAAAKRRAMAEPALDDDVITLTFDMYEHALKAEER